LDETTLSTTVITVDVKPVLVNPCTFFLCSKLFSTTALGHRQQRDVVNGITPNLKSNQQLKLKTTPVLLLQALRLAAAPCNIVEFSQKNEQPQLQL